VAGAAKIADTAEAIRSFFIAGPFFLGEEDQALSARPVPDFYFLSIMGLVLWTQHLREPCGTKMMRNEIVTH
jgi:hypothetical protein